MDLTLFELHLEDATFNAPYSGHSESTDSEDFESPKNEGEESVGTGLDARPFVGLLLLIGILALLRRYRSGNDDTSEVETDEVAISEV